MDNLTAVVILLVTAIIFCLFSIIIINIVDRRSLLAVEDEDFITKYLKKKKKFLRSYKIFSNISVYVMIVALVMIGAGALAFFFTTNVFVAAGAAIAGFFLPDILIRLFSGFKKDDFDAKYGASLMALAASLKAGLSIQQAVEEICLSKFVDEDIKVLYRNINSSIKMGTRVDKAFADFAEETGSVDARDVASAIALQEEIGGNEGETIETVARTIADRLDNKTTIKSLMTDSKMMINVFSVAPVIFLVLMAVMMPDLLTYYTSSVMGIITLVALVAVMYTSVFIASKMRKNALNIQ